MTDKRSVYVTSTEKARTLVAETEKKQNKILKEIEDRLGEEKVALLIELLEETQKAL